MSKRKSIIAVLIIFACSYCWAAAPADCTTGGWVKGTASSIGRITNSGNNYIWFYVKNCSNCYGFYDDGSTAVLSNYSMLISALNNGTQLVFNVNSYEYHDSFYVQGQANPRGIYLCDSFSMGELK